MACSFFYRLIKMFQRGERGGGGVFLALVAYLFDVLLMESMVTSAAASVM